MMSEQPDFMAGADGPQVSRPPLSLFCPAAAPSAPCPLSLYSFLPSAQRSRLLAPRPLRLLCPPAPSPPLPAPSAPSAPSVPCAPLTPKTIHLAMQLPRAQYALSVASKSVSSL